MFEFLAFVIAISLIIQNWHLASIASDLDRMERHSATTADALERMARIASTKRGD